MDAYKIKLNVTSRKELNRLYQFLVKNNFPIIPNSKYPQVQAVDKNLATVIFIVSSRGLKILEQGGYPVEIINDFSDEVDPREYVSKTNRFKAQLETLKQSR